MSPLPVHVRAEVRRILDAEARRLLAEQLDADALGAASVLGDISALDGRTTSDGIRASRAASASARANP